MKREMANLEYLIDFRKKHSKFVNQFADSIGIPQSTYHYIESGRTDMQARFIKNIVEKYPDFDIFTFLDVKNKYAEELDLLSGLSTEAYDMAEKLQKDLEKISEKAKKLEQENTALKDTTLEILLEERMKKNGRKEIEN